MGGSRGLDNLVDDILAHHGVKGQKWGVRRKRGSGPVSEDHVTVAGHKVTIKSHGTKALSNKELQQIATRLNLETQVSTLRSKQSNGAKGKKIVAELLAAGVTVNAAIAFAKSPAGQAIKKTLTK